MVPAELSHNLRQIAGHMKAMAATFSERAEQLLETAEILDSFPSGDPAGADDPLGGPDATTVRSPDPIHLTNGQKPTIRQKVAAATNGHFVTIAEICSVTGLGRQQVTHALSAEKESYERQERPQDKKPTFRRIAKG
jgi:hypothetical protein